MTGSNSNAKIHKRPPYHYVEGAVDFSKITVNAGLDPDIYSSRDFMVHVGIPALYELLSDGEIQIAPSNTALASFDAHQASAVDRHGIFYDKMAAIKARTYTESSSTVDDFNRLARFCGSLLAEQSTAIGRNSIHIPDTKVARPITQSGNPRLSIDFGGYGWNAYDATAKVLEYGPGLTGRVFINHQLGSLGRGSNDLQYVTISDGPFINQFLTDYLRFRADQQLGRGVGQLILNNSLFGGREDGMKQGSESLIEQFSDSRGSPDVFDVVLATGLHYAEKTELKHGIANSYKLLQPGGKLMVLSPIPKIDDQMTTFQGQLDMAEDAGFKVSWQSSMETGSRLLGKHTVSGLAVLEK